jgi:hypothetical protein
MILFLKSSISVSSLLSRSDEALSLSAKAFTYLSLTEMLFFKVSFSFYKALFLEFSPSALVFKWVEVPES